MKNGRTSSSLFAAIAVPVFREDFLRKLRDVIALVVVLRKFDCLALDLQVPQVYGTPQGPHLVAHVIDIVFLADVVAAGLQDVGNDVPRDGAPRVPDVQGARGVCADELHLDFLPRPEIERTVSVFQAIDFLERKRQLSSRIKKLMKPGPAISTLFSRRPSS